MNQTKVANVDKIEEEKEGEEGQGEKTEGEEKEVAGMLIWYFPNFSCMFLNPNIFSNMSSNCSNL